MATSVREKPSATPAKAFAQKLADGVREADKRLEPMRKNRTKFIGRFAGPYYTRAPSRRSGRRNYEIVNKVNAIVSTLTAHLATNRPKPNIKARSVELEHQAEVFSLAVEHVFIELKIEQTLRRLVMDAQFGPAILKTGIATGRPMTPIGDSPVDYLHDFGVPFVDLVDLDDYVLDAGCRVRSACWFEGNRVRMPFKAAADSGMYDNGKLEKLRHQRLRNKPDAAERLSEGGANSAMLDDIADEVELLELWLPRDGLIVTMAAYPDQDSLGLLREAEYVGPESGPYDMLGFNEIPGNALPAAAVGIWYDLARLYNSLANKAKQQAERTKNLVLYDLVKRGDAKNVRDAGDGELVGVDDPRAFQEVSFGGVNEKVFEALNWAGAELNNVAGNPDLLGGIAAVSGTLGQDQMLEGNARLKVADMWKRFHVVLASVTEKVAWYVWTDPLVDIDVVLQRGELAYPAKFKAELKEGDFLQYEFDVVPYSTQPRTPEEDFDRMMTYIERVALPLIQAGQAQGMTLDAQRIMEVTGKKLEMPEFASFFVQMDPAAGGEVGAQGMQPVVQPGRATPSTAQKRSRPSPAPAGAQAGGA